MVVETQIVFSDYFLQFGLYQAMFKIDLTNMRFVILLI
jgi:hypothetical protein